jgi:hypothetical protein
MGDLKDNYKKLTDEEIKLLKKIKETTKGEWGEDIYDFVKRCIEKRKILCTDFEAKFNGAKFTVEKDDTEKSLYWKWKYYQVV